MPRAASKEAHQFLYVMPTGLCYAMFTWNSIGIIDEQSMLNMTYEAWIRNPATI